MKYLALMAGFNTKLYSWYRLTFGPLCI